MGMSVVIEVLIGHLNRHRERLDAPMITLIDKLVETGEQPDETQKEMLYRAERRLRFGLGDEEFYRRN